MSRVDTIAYRKSVGECLHQARTIIEPLLTRAQG